VNWDITLGGFVVGTLIGLTGMGGGLIMTPMLIFLFGVNPSVAVGTDLVYASITKLVGAWQHARQKTVDFALVKILAWGSVPGALLGSFTVSLIQRHLSQALMSAVMNRMLGITYLIVTVIMLWRVLKKQKDQTKDLSERKLPSRWVLITLGFIIGTLVGLTSVGSGTLFIAVLVVIYPIAAAKLVGTDIVQALIVTGIAGLAHLAMHNVNLPMVASLLAGSIPGILLGSKFVLKIPDRAIRVSILCLLVLSSFKLLVR